MFIFSKKERKPTKKYYAVESQRRFLVTRQGCPYCQMWTAIVSYFNTKLKPSRMIHIVDATLYDKFGRADHPILKRFGRQIAQIGYPFLYIDGIIRSGSLSKEENMGFLLGVLSAKGEV